jgi:signal transduction histidine kinase
VRIELDLAAGLPAVYGDRILLEQVMLNLMRNGLDAMNAQEPERRVLTARSRRDGDSVRVSVEDRGIGIAEEQMARIFTPFYTTKAEGLGIGLNICRSVIEFHNGRLWTEPHPEGGAVFHFTVPLASLAAKGETEMAMLDGEG